MKLLIFLFVLLNFLNFALCETQILFPLVQKSRNLLEIQKYVKQREALNEKIGKGGKFLLSNYPQDYIVLNLTVGTPPQPFNVAIETGRPDLWVLGQYYSNLQPGQNTYSPDDSSTSNYVGYFSGNSANLQIYGDTYVDWLSLGDVAFNQTFGSVSDIYSATEVGFPLDGVLGLSWSLYGDYDSPIQNILKFYNSTDGVYTTWLGPHVKPSEGNGEGKIALGVDTESCNKSINYVSLSSFNSYLTFNVDGLEFGKYSSLTTKQGVVDSGYPVLLFSSDDYRPIYKQINPDYDWDTYLFTIDCNAAANLTDFQYTIGGNVYSVPSSQYVLDLEIGGGKCAVAFGLNEDTYDIPDYVLGNVFIRQYCITYNTKKSTLGLSASVTAK